MLFLVSLLMGKMPAGDVSYLVLIAVRFVRPSRMFGLAAIERVQ